MARRYSGLFATIIIPLSTLGSGLIQSSEARARAGEPSGQIKTMTPTAVKPQNKPTKRPDLRGVWISLLTSTEDPRWTIEQRVCVRCVPPALERLRRILDDPESADRPIKEIRSEINTLNEKYVSGLLTQEALAFRATYDPADDPVINCKPGGLFTQADPLPMQIEQYEDRVVFRHEYFNSVRTVYTDGRGHPADLKPSRLGHSIGWYDGDTLVVDTVGIEPHLIAGFAGGMRASNLAQGIERYTRSQDGDSLEREMTIIDPRTFRQPLILTKPYLYGPKEKLQEFECKVRSGVMED